MLAALDAMPERRLIAREFQRDGEVCALASVARQRGVDLSDIDPEDCDACYPIAARLGIAPAMAAEIMWENDDVNEYTYAEAHGPPTRYGCYPHRVRYLTTPEGIDERDPETGKVNRYALMEEIADVEALIEMCKREVGIPRDLVALRREKKIAMKTEWIRMLREHVA